MKKRKDKAERIVIAEMRAPDFLNEPIEYGKSFSRGVRVDAGGFTVLYISGTASVDENGKTCYPEKFSAQAQRTFDNITALLRSEGATWHDVAKTRCYLKRMKDYDAFNRVRSLFYRNAGLRRFPASVCVEARLCRPDLLVEIEATAIIDNKRAHQAGGTGNVLF